MKISAQNIQQEMTFLHPSTGARITAAKDAEIEESRRLVRCRWVPYYEAHIEAVGGRVYVFAHNAMLEVPECPCHNSPHYYSPEQERYDDMMDDGSDDIRERYAATMEAEQYIDYEDEPFTTETDEPEIPFEPVELQGQPNPDDTDDIPF